MPRKHYWRACEPLAPDDVRELLAAHGADEAGALRHAAHGVVYYGPGTEWTPPPLPAAERLQPPAPPAPKPRRVRFSHEEMALYRRSSLPAPGVVTGRVEGSLPTAPAAAGAESTAALTHYREPMGDLAYWTPERLANLRERLRAVGLPEIRPGVFRWTPGAGGSCEPNRS